MNRTYLQIRLRARLLLLRPQVRSQASVSIGLGLSDTFFWNFFLLNLNTIFPRMGNGLFLDSGVVRVSMKVFRIPPRLWNFSRTIEMTAN